MAEGGGLLNRYTVQSRIKGSNPFLSATLRRSGFEWQASCDRWNTKSNTDIAVACPR